MYQPVGKRSRRPGELAGAPAAASGPSSRLAAWLASVQRDLAAWDGLAPPRLDPENLARLRPLGYGE